MAALRSCSDPMRRTPIRRNTSPASSIVRELGLNHTHLSETKGEVENIKQQYGKSPIAWFNDLGPFDTGCLAAHCVWVDDDDMDIMLKKHVRVAHNPGSNLKLASGVCSHR